MFNLSEEEMMEILKKVHSDGYNSGWDDGFEDCNKFYEKQRNKMFEQFEKHQQDEFLRAVNLGKPKH